MSVAGRFVGVGVGSYAVHGALKYAVPQVRLVHSWVADVLDGEPLRDPDEGGVRTALKGLPKLGSGGPLLLMWAGHAVPAEVVGLQLLTADSGTEPGDGIAVTDVVTWCSRTGASQVLVVLDTCFSAGGAEAAARAASAVMALRPPDADHLWVGVLASCLPAEKALDGEFGRRLVRLLREGPWTPDLRRRWSVHNEFLRGDDLCDALVKEWDSDLQTPEFRARGSAWWMLRNPLHTPGSPAVVVEHLLLAARGGDDPGRSWFTGRTGEVNRVVSWVASRTPGVRVVTGSAGTGKSAVVGRVVSVANPIERARLDGQGLLGHADPGVGSVHGHAHARGRTADQVAELLDADLTRRGPNGEPGFLAPREGGRRNAALLVGELQAHVQAGGLPPVVVVDGLDEARVAAFEVARELLVRLAPFATVIVSTRQVREPVEGGEATLVGVLDPVDVLDLDEPAWAASGVAAVHGYLVARLSGVSERMDQAAVAEHVVSSGSFGVGVQPFLLARVVADQLRAHPVDTTLLGWGELVPASITAAVDVDIARTPAPTHRALPPGVDLGAFARGLLVALTWGLGSGLPEAEWYTVAEVTCADLGVGEVSADDVSWVLGHLGRYVVQDGEAGAAVYRLAHQSIADHLRPRFTPTAQVLFEPAAAPVAAALLARYRGLLVAGVPAQDPGYLWRYAWAHAAAAGPEGLAGLRDLAQVSPALRPDVAEASLVVADTLSTWGRRLDALPPTQDAVEIYRELAGQDARLQPALAQALTALTGRLSAVGQRFEALEAARESVAAYRALTVGPDDSPLLRLNLAGNLSNLGNQLAQVGERAEALTACQEAVDLLRTPGADEPAAKPYLAMALNNLGIRLSEVGRLGEALAATQEAVSLRRVLAEENPAFVPDLASSLTNLGVGLSEVGQREEAVAPAQEAVALYRVLARENPAFLPDLATSLNNLGNRLSGVGRREEAVAPAQEALALNRILAEENATFAPELAMSLSNLGVSLSRVGRRVEALALTQEAIALRRVLAEENPALVPDLAMSLNNLGISLSEVGRPVEALASTREAVELYRGLARENPAFLPDLAMVLNNLGNRLSEAGRLGEALSPAQEAVEIYRVLAGENSAFVADLAGSLSNLGNRLADVGRRGEALAPAQEAVDEYRVLAAHSPAFSPGLAMSLSNLGIRLSEAGCRVEALAATLEAVQEYRVLAEQSPVFVADLARSLTNLGIGLSEVGRPEEALAPTAEAVEAYRVLASENPALVPDLARSLANLGLQLSGVGRPVEALAPARESVEVYVALVGESPHLLPALVLALSTLAGLVPGPGEVEAVWREAMSGVDRHDGAVLLLLRAQAASDDDPGPLGWLAEALDGAGDDAALVAAVHDEARRRRRVDPAGFDAVWQDRVGPVPAWVSVDTELLESARAWVDTGTYTEEADYLASHPELLEEAADSAADEALLAAAGEDAGRYRELRVAAREHGVEAAYRPLLLSVLAHVFAGAGPDEQRDFLATRQEDLLDPVVAEVLDRLAGGDDEQRAAAGWRALALLRLAADPDGTEVLEGVLDALVDPDAFAALLASASRRADPAPLGAVAEVALSAARGDGELATAMLYAAVAAVLDGQEDAAAEWVVQARRVAPEQRDRWVSEVAQIAAVHPRAVGLIPVLMSPLPVEGGDDRDVRPSQDGTS